MVNNCTSISVCTNNFDTIISVPHLNSKRMRSLSREMAQSYASDILEIIPPSAGDGSPTSIICFKIDNITQPTEIHIVFSQGYVLYVHFEQHVIGRPQEYAIQLRSYNTFYRADQKLLIQQSNALDETLINSITNLRTRS